MRAAIRTSSGCGVRRPFPWRAPLLAGALLTAASCATGPFPIREEANLEIRPLLSGASADQAEALARYSQFLILQDTHPESERLPGVLSRAVQADPGALAFRLWLGNAYLGRGKAAEAVPGLEEAVRRFPDSDALLFMLGQAYEGAGRSPEARRAYRRVIKRAPRKPESYVRLAGLSLREEKIREAFAVLDDGLRRVEDPLAILAVYDYLGEQFVVARKPWFAAVCYRRISDRQPDNLAARERLMRCELAAGNRAEARRNLEILASKDIRPEWYQLLGELAEDANDAAAAAGWYGRAINSGAPAGARIRLGLLQARTNLVEGLATLRAGARIFPKDPQASVAAGALLFNAGRNREAIAEFEEAESRIRAAESEPGVAVSPLFYFWYGAACDQAGQIERAESLFEQSIRLFPRISESYNYLAYLWAQRGVNLDLALAYSLKSLEIKPDDPAYLDTLGWIYFRKGELEQALRHVRRAAEKGADPDIRQHLGDILKAMGRPEEAAR